MVTSRMHKGFVFITAYLSTFLYVGLINSLGNIFIDVRETFNASRAETAVIQSTANGVSPGLAFIAGLLILKAGLVKSSLIFAIITSVGAMSTYLATEVWHMILTIGVLYGSGVGNIFICSTIAIGDYFTDRRRLFLWSIHGTSVPIGSMLFAYILPYMSSCYGFRGALLIIGGVFLNVIPCCLLWKKPINDHANTETPENQEETNALLKRLKMIMENRRFVCFWIGITLANMSINIMLVFIADIFRDKLLSKNDATIGLILFGLCNIVGRILLGIIMLIHRLPVLTCPLLSTLLLTGFTIGLVISTSKWMVLCFYGLIGTSFGMIYTTYGVTTSKLVGLKNLSTAMGLIFTTIGILNAATGPASGHVRDTIGTYKVPIYTGRVLSAIGSIMIMFALVQECREQFQSKQRSTVLELTSM